MRKNKIFNFVILIFISCSLCVMTFLQLKQIIFLHPDNIKTFYAFKQSFNFYKSVMQNPWKPRLFSCVLASFLMPKNQILKSYTTETEDEKYLTIIELKDKNIFYIRVGIWTILWLFSINLIFIILKKEKSIFYLLALFTALTFIYIPSSYVRVYPWDLPALFFYSLSIYILIKRKFYLLFFITPLATGFKETTMLLSFLFLIWEEKSLKERIIYTFITLFFCIIIKSFLGLITQTSTIFYSMEYNPDLLVNLKNEIISLFKGNFYNIIFINGGLTFTFLLLPSKEKEILLLKFISIIFILFNFLYGNLKEYRIFLEITPFSIYAFDKLFLNSFGVKSER